MSSIFHLQIHGPGASLGHWMDGPRRAVREEAQMDGPDNHTCSLGIATFKTGVVVTVSRMTYSPAIGMKKLERWLF